MDAVTEYRASFDATVRFSNGGDLAVHGFRVDVPGPDVGQAGIAALFVASLGLLMTETNTGTYLDSPYHRFAGGADLAAIPLERTAGLPAVLIRVTGAQARGIGVGALAAVDVRGAAVLLHTGDDARFGTPEYAAGAHFLTRAGAEWLASQEPALVGIDAINMDDAGDARRPAHTLLLAAGIPVVEHLTGLGQLPATGAAFYAVPLRIEGFGSIPVRAFAQLPA
jgi:kynurenine formamidase